MAQGSVVFTPIDNTCHVQPSQLLRLVALAPGKKETFRFPLSARTLHHYRLQLQAFDDEGFGVPFIDDNAAVLEARLPEQREWCQTVR